MRMKNVLKRFERCADRTTDMVTEMGKAMFEKDEAKKKELLHTLATEKMPNFLKFFEERAAKSGSGFLAASGLTWADLYLVCALEYLGEKHDATLENYKNLKALDQKVHSHPKIAEWISKRPKSDF